jgi:hypothetical protein
MVKVRVISSMPIEGRKRNVGEVICLSRDEAVYWTNEGAVTPVEDEDKPVLETKVASPQLKRQAPAPEDDERPSLKNEKIVARGSE